MVARLCAVAFIAFASLLVAGHGIAVAADDSYGQSGDSYSTPDAAEHPAAPDDGSTPPPEDDALVFGVGVIGLPLGFVPHVFFPDKAAELIGWAPSPFQLEVGFHDGAWGILGFLCIWIGGLFWLATGLGWSFFMLGATYGHIRETVSAGNYAPYNFFTIFSDGFIGIWILVLLYLYWRQGGFRK